MGRLKILDNEGKLQDFDPSGYMTVTAVGTRHHTLTIAEVVGGIIIHTVITGTANVATPSAANIIAGYNGKGALLDIGDTVMCYYINDSAGVWDITFTAGSSVTIADATQKIGQNESAIILFRKTSATAVTCYTIGGRV